MNVRDRNHAGQISAAQSAIIVHRRLHHRRAPTRSTQDPPDFKNEDHRENTGGDHVIASGPSLTKRNFGGFVLIGCGADQHIRCRGAHHCSGRTVRCRREGE
jgi:hypothetical protein